MNNVKTLLTGATGTALIEATQNIDLNVEPSVNNLVGLIIQTVIGLITIFKLLKKKKSTNNQTSQL